MKRRVRSSGFTLIECVVTVFLLAVGVVGVASMFVYANLSERKAAYADLARDAAEQTLEKVRAQGYGVFTQPSGTTTIPTPGLPRSACVLAWQPYPDVGSEQGLKLVALNLTWSWAGPSSGHYRLITLMSNPDGG
jgi:prepilin-type N-terminal cleavage/methylation domain-containing protein